MKIKKRNSFSILIFVFLFLIFTYGFKHILKKEDRNIYNVGSKIKVQEQINSKAFIIYDEYVFDSIENFDEELEEKKIYRKDDYIGQEINEDNQYKALKNLDFIKEIKPLNINNDKDYKSNKKPISYNNYLDLKKNILNGKINKINYNYLDSLNIKQSFYNDFLDENQSYINSGKIKVAKSGYFTKSIDGYESLFNINNLNDLPINFYNIGKVNNDIEGLKYINNRKYFLAVKIEDFNNKDIIIDRDYPLVINKEIEVNGTVYKINEGLNNDALVIFKVLDGFDSIQGKRSVLVDIIKGEELGFMLPSESIVERNGKNGVYILENRQVHFRPVKILQENYQENKSIVITKKESIYTPYELDEYKDIKELNEFDDILINHKKLEEGDYY